MQIVFELHRNLSKDHPLSAVLYLFQVIQTLQLLRYAARVAGYSDSFLQYFTFSPWLDSGEAIWAVLGLYLSLLALLASIILICLCLASQAEFKSVADTVYLFLRRLIDLARFCFSLPFLNYFATLCRCDSIKLQLGVCFSGMHLGVLIGSALLGICLFGGLIYEGLMGEEVICQRGNIGARTPNSIQYLLVVGTGAILEGLLGASSGIGAKVTFAVTSVLLVINCYFNGQFKHHITRRIDRICCLVLLYANSLQIGAAMGLQSQVNVAVCVLLVLPAGLLGVLEGELDIQEEVENMNRWSSPRQLIRIKENLLRLLQTQSPYRKMLFLGYLHVHKERCDRTVCVIRDWKIGAEEAKPVLRQSIKVQMQDGARIFPNNVDLKLQYAKFLLKYARYQLALKELIDSNQEAFDYPQRYLHFVLMRAVRDVADQDRANHGHLNLVLELDQERRYEQLKLLFQECAVLNVNFWSLVLQQKCSPHALGALAHRRMVLDLQVRALFKQMSALGTKKKVQYYYNLFLTLLQNEVLELNSNNVTADIKEWQNLSLPILVVDFQNQVPSIVRANAAASSLLGFFKSQLEGSDLTKILPGPEKVAGWQNCKSSRNFVMYFLKRNGYAVQCVVETYEFNSLKSGTLHVLSLSPRGGLEQAHFLISTDYKIEAVTGLAYSLLGFQAKGDDFLNLCYPLLFRKDKPHLGVRRLDLAELAPAQYVPPRNCKLQLDFTQYLPVSGKHTGYLVKAILVRQNTVEQPMPSLPAGRPFVFVYKILDRTVLIGSDNDTSISLPMLDQIRRQQQLQESKERSWQEQVQSQHLGQDVKTVRLGDGVINYIVPETGEQQMDENFADSRATRMEYSEEVEMFRSKESLQTSYREFTIGGSLLARHRFGLLALAIFYFASFATAYSTFQNNKFPQQLGYEHLRAGGILSLLERVSILQFSSPGYFPGLIDSALAQVPLRLQVLQNFTGMGLPDFYMANNQYASQLYGILVTDIYQLIQEAQIGNDLSELVKAILQQGQYLESQLRKNAAVYLSQQGSSYFIYVIFVVGVGLLVAQTAVFIHGIAQVQNQEQSLLKIFLSLHDSQVNLYVRRTQLFLKSLRNENQNNEVQGLAESGRKEHRRKRKKFSQRGLSGRLVGLSLLRGAVFFIYLVLFVTETSRIAEFSSSSLTIINQTTLNLNVYMAEVLRFQRAFAQGKWPNLAPQTTSVVTQIRQNSYNNASISDSYTKYLNQLYTGVGKQPGLYDNVQTVFGKLQDFSSGKYTADDSLGAFSLIYSTGEQLVAQSTILLSSYVEALGWQLAYLVLIFVGCLGAELLSYGVVVERLLRSEVGRYNVEKEALSLIPPQVCRQLDEAHQFFIRHKANFFNLN